MAVQVLIDNVDRSDFVLHKTLQVSDAIGQRTTCRFQARDLDGSLADVLVPGETVEVLFDGSKVFGGTIDRVEQINRPGTSVRLYQVDCVDWHQICDRRIVAETYENTAAGDIVADLVAKYLKAEGVMGTRDQPSFTRSSPAYLPDGTQVAENEPRFVEIDGRKALMVEEGTTNLISNPSFEDGLTGWTVMTVASFTVEEREDVLFGQKCARLIHTGDETGHTHVSQTFSVTEGQTYTLSCYIKYLSGPDTATIFIRWYDSSGQLISQDILWIPVSYDWKQVSVTGTAPSGAATANCYLYGQQGYVFDVLFDAVQLEQKPYATSFIDGTRDKEILTVPGDVINPTKGTWEQWVLVNDLAKRQVSGQYPCIMYIPGTVGSGRVLLFHSPASPTWYLESRSDDGVYRYATFDDSYTPDGWHLFTVVWDLEAGYIKVYVDGVLRGTITSDLPSALGATSYVGTLNGSYQIDTLIDDIRISSRVRTDDEILTAYQSGKSLQVDAWTTYLLRFDGSLEAETPIQAGPNVVEAVFNYVPATTCLDKLAEQAGFSWWIDAQKVLHFVERATYQAPWALDDASKVNNLCIEKYRQGYRNRQYVKAGKDVTDPQTEQFKGDGASRTWTVGFPIAKVPTVRVNGVTKTVGIKGIDTGKDFYWNKGDPVITQDSAGTILTSSDVLEVTYQGFFDVVVLTTDEAAIEERKNVEGGSGWYEAVEDEPYLSSREAAIQSANAKLRRYARLTKQITFDTHLSGLRPGQILNVNLPERGLLNEEFLIEEVTFSRIGGQHWRYDVRAVSGEALGGWTRFFRNMATRGQAFVIRENIREDQVLIYLAQASETWDWTEVTNVQVFSCPIPSTELYPSTDLYPC